MKNLKNNTQLIARMIKALIEAEFTKDEMLRFIYCELCIGEKVNHKTFGEGVFLGVDITGGRSTLLISFDGELKKLTSFSYLS